MPVTQEQNITHAQLVTDLLIEHAEERYTDLLTPEQAKAHRQREERERIEKQVRENMPLIDKLLTDEDIDQLAKVMTRKEFNQMGKAQAANSEKIRKIIFSPERNIQFKKE